jgi:hypothetical protein
LGVDRREILPIEMNGPLREARRRMEELAEFCRENDLNFVASATEFSHTPGFDSATHYTVDFTCRCASQVLIDNVHGALEAELSKRLGGRE